MGYILKVFILIYWKISMKFGVVKTVDWFVGGVDYYNKSYKEIFIINIPLKEETITPLYTSCCYCHEEMADDFVRDHDHFNAKFRGYAHNKCNLQAKNTFVPMYTYN